MSSESFCRLNAVSSVSSGKLIVGGNEIQVSMLIVLNVNINEVRAANDEWNYYVDDQENIYLSKYNGNDTLWLTNRRNVNA